MTFYKSTILLLKSIVTTLNKSLSDEDIHSVVEQVIKEVEQVIKESGEDLSYSDYLFWVNFIYTRYRQLGMDLEALKVNLKKTR